jgi:hypothetical protein
MKLFEVLTPSPVYLMTEGYSFNQTPEGTVILDYDPSDPATHDKIMTKRMRGLQSKKRAGRMQVDPPRGVDSGNFDVYSRKEQHEFQPHYNPDTFLSSIPTFFGLALDPGKKDTPDREQYKRILDALKGRNGHSTTPAAMEAMMQQSAKSIMKQIAAHYRQIEKANNIIVIPIPSSSKLPRMFASVLADTFGSEGRVATVNDMLEQNLNYKVGSAGGKETQAGNLPNLYRRVVNEFRAGGRSEEQVLGFFDEAEKFLTQKLNDPNTPESDIELYQKDMEFMKRAEEEFFDAVGTEDAPGAARQQQVHGLHGGTRRHAYDRVRVRRDAEVPTADPKTVYVLADDNVDHGRTIVDVYRYLYKHGLFNKEGTKVIGAVMHHLGADLKR